MRQCLLPSLDYLSTLPLRLLPFLTLSTPGPLFLSFKTAFAEPSHAFLLSPTMATAARPPTTPTQSKVSSRPRSVMTRQPMSRAALAAHHDNLPSLPDSPQSLLAPAPGAPKLKVKAATTPEARSRVLLKPKGSTRRLAPRSGGDDDGWLSGQATHAAVLDSLDPAPVLAPSDNVLVSIRVRPHNAAELQRDDSSAWNTPTYDQRLIKLAKGRDGGRDDREWFFGAQILLSSGTDIRSYLVLRDRQCSHICHVGTRSCSK